MRPLPETLGTSRLRLRCAVTADASSIFQSYAQDPTVCRFLIWRPHTSESITQDFIATCVEEWKTGNRLPYVITELR